MNRQSSKRKRFGVVIGCTLALFFAACASTLRNPQQTPAVISTAAATSIVPATVQATPTLSKEELEIEQIKLENEKIKNENDWWWVNKASIITALLSMAGVIGAVWVGFRQWRGQQKADREKRDEDRFQAIIDGLGSERVEARVGAAIMLRTFVRPGYEQFCSQAFDLAVSHLRLRKADPRTPEPLDSLSQALIAVLKESFPLTRGDTSQFKPESLDATGVHLDNAYLSKSDLRKIRLRGAFLRGAYFWDAQLQGAYLKHSNLKGAFLAYAHLEDADLGDTILVNANLSGAYLKGAHLRNANLDGANFTEADLSDTRIQNAKSLKGTILRGVIGLSPSQLSACAAKGAIIDDVKSP
jgi:uncharacterized protein YjbI with pentapeptide repeats